MVFLRMYTTMDKNLHLGLAVSRPFVIIILLADELVRLIAGLLHH